MKHGFVLLVVTSIALLSDAVAFATEGRTPGQFAVSPTGSAQYTIPIWAPPGPRGMQPNISLTYDSQSGIGPLGIGWTIGGLGAITRCNRTVAQDTIPAPVQLVTGDGYCINGSRLRLTSGTTGIAGSVYQTEIADFSQITANGTAGNGPASFTVKAKNGLTYYYGYVDSNGNGANSQVLAHGTSTALTWLLSKVIDRAGNNYVINYTAQTGTAVPNDILWTPTSAGASTYAYKMLFNYPTPNVPQSSIHGYVDGTLVSNTELLSSIQIFSGTTVVKDYFLGYQASPLTAREELVSVTECADSVKANCLIPTTVGYKTGSPGLSTTSNSAVSSIGGGLTARYDVNGDGYPDLVYTNATGTVYVAFGSATGYGAPFSIGASGSVLVGNLTGGNQDGILVIGGGAWSYYTWNGSSFVATSSGVCDSAGSQWQLADINGDGRPDLIELVVTAFNPQTRSSTATVNTRLNTGTGSTVSFSSLTAAATFTGILTAQLETPDTQWGKLRRFDFNGDGLDDLVLETLQSSDQKTVNTYELLSNPTEYFTTSLIVSTLVGSEAPVLFTNWNDDKCTDFVFLNTLYLSGCNGTASETYTLAGTAVAALDWDGDGRTDLMVANGSTLGVYLSKATGAPTLTATSIPYTSTCQYVWMDANGDGLDDLGCWSRTGSYPLNYYLHNGTSDLATAFVDGYGNSASPTYVPLSESNYVEHSGTEATFPDADYTGPMYVVSEAIFSDPSKAAGNTYNQTFEYYAAWTNLQGRGFDGFGITRMLDSRNGLYDYKYYERAFPYTGMQYQEIISNGTFYPSESTGTTALTTLSSTTNEQRYFPYFSNWTTKKWEVGGAENADLITTSSTNYTYDNYGNALTVDTTVTDNDSGSPYNGYTWTTNTTNTSDISVNPSTDLAAWCLTTLDETQVVYSSTYPGSTAVTRTQQFTPDTPAECRIKTAITEPTSGLYKVTEALTFDSFGNIYTDTVTGANMPASPASRVTTLNWGTTGQFLNALTDPSNATATLSYTSNQALTFGVPDSVKNPNNLTTSWGYDVFGRKIKETRPDGTSTTWTLTACTLSCGWSNSVYQIAQTAYQTNGTTAIRTDTTSYDPIDRITQIAGPTVTGATATTQKLYNSMGLLAQQSMPFLSGTPYQKTFAYDVLNRLVESERPVKASGGQTYCNPATVPPAAGCQGTSFGYAGRKITTTDPKGNIKTTITDVKGRLRQTKDGVGYNVIRAYDSAGSLIGVTDSVGNSLLKGVTINYGIKPFRVAATDADRGAWTYTVDSLGERTSWTDAKGQTFSMTYDALSRPLTRTEPDLFTQWTWGSTPASYNVGQLIGECTGTGSVCVASTGYSETRAFDSYGRLSTRSITQAGNPGNDPGGVFLFTNGYDSTTGFLNALTYPITTSGTGSPLKIQYGYGYGLLSSATDTSDTTSTCGSTCTLWTANAMNGFGEITQETLGNGVVMNRTYDAVTSWLSGATAGVGGGATLLNQSYLEDANGNIIQRQQDNTPGITESFNYDADNRLTCTALASTCTTATLAYDAGVAGPGNITSQTGLGTYTYPAAGQPRPHAVSSITGTFNGIVNPSFSYDANGNMTDRASSTQNIYWFSYNYPSSISGTDTTGSEEVQFTYGPDRQRWKQIYTGPSGIETTYYIGGLIDLVFNGTTNYRQYIYAGREPVAVYRRTSAGVNTMSYMLEDHQGGISAIASSAGTINGTTGINESFSAFGQRRDPSTWSGAPSTGELSTIAGLSRQGYTFQTWLGQSMGLNHLNGRVQDGILGRFLSPDPHITDPTSAQSYNRYSYVNNNPLTYTDPTGFDCGGPPATPIFPDDGTGQTDVGDLPEVVVNGQCAPPEHYDIPPPQYTEVPSPPPNEPMPSFPKIAPASPAQGKTSPLCTAVNVAIGGLSGAAGGAVTGGFLGGLGGSAIGAGVGFALGVAGALIPQGGFAGGALAAVITLVAHAASGTNASAFTSVLTDTGGGAAGDNAVAGIAIASGGTAAAEAFAATAGEVGASAAEGGVAGAAGALTSLATNAALSRLAKAAGCP